MNNPHFGGSWTEQKLAVLEGYLDSYTTALKDKPFKLIYIDAFAGSGKVEASISEDSSHSDVVSFLDGSPIRALKVTDKSFDELIFIEKDLEYYTQLRQRLESNHPERNVRIHNEDANIFLLNLLHDWNSCRGVLFLDPFATQVEFRTIQKVASFNALDTWILVPIATISRLLPKKKDPDAISQKWTQRLNRIYGDDSWRELYQVSPQGELFHEHEIEREPGNKGLRLIYQQKLKDEFQDRFLSESLELKNSRNSVMYELMFFCGNRSVKAIETSHQIAKHLINKMSAHG